MEQYALVLLVFAALFLLALRKGWFECKRSSTKMVTVDRHYLPTATELLREIKETKVGEILTLPRPSKPNYIGSVLRRTSEVFVEALVFVYTGEAIADRHQVYYYRRFTLDNFEREYMMTVAQEPLCPVGVHCRK